MHRSVERWIASRAHEDHKSEIDFNGKIMSISWLHPDACRD
jgi:hypothetical protein